MKRSIISPEQLSRESRLLFDFLNKEETDVARVVVAAAFLDAALAGLVAEFMLRGSTTAAKLLSPTGALGAFQVRTDLAYALGLLNKTHFEELCTVARIRNHFAHSHLQLTFDDPQVQTWCDSLKAWDATFTPDEAFHGSKALGARNRFTLSVVLLSQRLLLDALSLNAKESAQYPRYNQMK